MSQAGNGDAELCNFGARVTPNEHQLVRDFVLLDNTYCCGMLSADGHQWTDSALANDYIERRSLPAGRAVIRFGGRGRAGIVARRLHLG